MDLSVLCGLKFSWAHDSPSEQVCVIFFTLWRNGGPNFIKEKAKWDLEQDLEWQLARRPKSRSYAEVAKSSGSKVIPSHAAARKSVFSSLHPTMPPILHRVFVPRPLMASLILIANDLRCVLRPLPPVRT